MSRRNLGGRLYRGEISFDFVSRQKLWYTISGCILVISLLALIFRGLDYSVEFKGGSVFTVPATSSVTQTGLDQVVTANGGTNPTVSEVKPFNGKAPYWQVQTTPAVHDEVAGRSSARSRTSSTSTSATCRSRRWGRAGAPRCRRRRSRR